MNYNKPLKLEHINDVFGTLDKRISSAKATLWISGNDLAAVNSQSSEIENALKKGVQIRVLHAHADLAEMLAAFDDRFSSANHFINQLNSTKSTLDELSLQYNNLQVRSSKILFPCGFFISDHGSDPKNRLVKIEIYACKPIKYYDRMDLPSGRAKRLNMVLNDKDRWDDFYIQQFENLWSIAEKSE